MPLIDRFYLMSDTAHAAYQEAQDSLHDGFPELAADCLRTVVILKNRMRLIAWNSPQVQAIVKKECGQEVESDSCLLRY